ncbi:uncharacterized protein LOC134842860 [Symsagittifera roscoffensis]|uniref:uncharacterized protein LOC134842860 n=1 Tax=Symsagittifera roscoffensis TaxID=84072 RepID=UPI00307C79F2
MVNFDGSKNSNQKVNGSNQQSQQNSRKSSQAASGASRTVFQGSERQRLLYIERESYCAVEADLKRTWEHPESRHFGIPYWESHAFDPPRNGGVNEPREPFGVKALDIQSDKFQGRRHFPKKQGQSNITYM